MSEVHSPHQALVNPVLRVVGVLWHQVQVILIEPGLPEAVVLSDTIVPPLPLAPPEASVVRRYAYKFFPMITCRPQNADAEENRCPKQPEQPREYRL